MEQAIDLDLERLTAVEIEGAYRSLCGAMLLRAAQEMCVTPRLSKGGISARQITRQWVSQDLGLITFSEACYACNVGRRWYLTCLANAAQAASVRRQATVRSPSQLVFGRQTREPVSV